MKQEVDLKPSDIDCSSAFNEMTGSSDTEEAARQIVLYCIDHGDKWDQRIPGNCIFGKIENWLEEREGGYYVTQSFIHSLQRFKRTLN